MYIFNGFTGNDIIRKLTELPNWNHYKPVMETMAVMEPSQTMRNHINSKKRPYTESQILILTIQQIMETGNRKGVTENSKFLKADCFQRVTPFANFSGFFKWKRPLSRWQKAVTSISLSVWLLVCLCLLISVFTHNWQICRISTFPLNTKNK